MVDSTDRPLISRRTLLSRGVGLAAGALAAGPLVSACGSTASSTKSGLEIGVLYASGSPFFDAYKRAGDKVAKDGTSVKYTFANTEARPKLELRWKNGNPPDIDYVFNSGDRTSLHYASEGKLMDLTSKMQSTSWGDGKNWDAALLPAFQHFAQYQGKYFMAPESAVVMGVYYNGKLFDSMGLQPPTTWAELTTTIQAIRKKGVSPVAVTGTFEPYMGLWWDHLLLREIGEAAVMDVAFNGKKLADQPGALEAANKLAAMVRDKAFLDGFAGTDFTAAQAAFFQGKAAMILMGSWLQGEMKASIPAGFDLRVTPFPTVEGGQGDQQGLFGTLLGPSVWAKTKNATAAVDYLKFSDAKDEQSQRVKDLGIVSPYQSVPTPTGITGTDKLLQQATSGKVTYYYYGISQDTQRSPAWYKPVAQLFLGKISAQQLISTIDSNLAGIHS
jgi:raffinose/stachyose/melibiose transport system substrate-binding protein